jgi:hypothetical protein
MLIRELIPGYLEELKILNRSPLTIRNILYDTGYQGR